MTNEVKSAFQRQRQVNFMMGIDRNITVEGYDGFIFTAKTGRPLQPSAVNNILYNIVKAYNKDELKKAKKEHRKAELLPKFSAHVLRHTACTRMAEKGMDIKVLQYLMGHSDISVTLNTYTHLKLDDAKEEVEKLARAQEAAEEISRAEGKADLHSLNKRKKA